MAASSADEQLTLAVFETIINVENDSGERGPIVR